MVFGWRIFTSERVLTCPWVLNWRIFTQERALAGPKG